MKCRPSDACRNLVTCVPRGLRKTGALDLKGLHSAMLYREGQPATLSSASSLKIRLSTVAMNKTLALPQLEDKNEVLPGLGLGIATGTQLALYRRYS
jgi:hypothetical protein